MTVVLIEVDEGRVGLVSREALTFARSLGAGPVHALALGGADAAVLADCMDQGVAVVHVATNPELERYAAAAWASALEAVIDEISESTVVAPGTPRGLEVLAHVAARRGVAMAANVTGVATEPDTSESDTSESDRADHATQPMPARPLLVNRQVVGGLALEQMALPDALRLMAVAGHAIEPVPAVEAPSMQTREFSAPLQPDDLRAQVARVIVKEGGDTSSLTSARVVVGAGRGVGGPDQFADVEALAARLGGAVGVSRVVTSLGWRPHHEQVGQTGSRIAPDLYIACGISGAIQHWAGCASSKTILAVNTDAEAPMMTKANYAVVGDMHEVIPAVLELLAQEHHPA